MNKRYIFLFAGLISISRLLAQNTFPLNGNVGIGTTNPLSSLHVNNSMAISAAGDGTNYYYQFQRPADGWINSRIGNAYSFNAYGGEIVFETNTGASLTSLAERMRIKFNGNVGIGTSSPNGLLQVNGTFIASGGNSNIDTTTPGYVPAQLNFLANSGLMLIGWNRSGGAGETSFISNPGPGWGGGFAFYNHDNSNVETQLMYIRADGTVGIGTDNTRGYKLAVNGSVRAKEIRVEAVPWPDYVFKPSYRLPSLSKIKIYIDENHHLPEIPSQKKIAEKGLNLGEMNMLLVKKVEELTLYLIEKDSQLKDVQKQINDLKVSWIKQKKN